MLRKYRNNIVDIFVFGSFLKEKRRPGDIDLYVMLKDTEERFVQEIYRDFKKEFGKEAHFNWVFAERVLEDPVLATVIEEGVSLKSGVPLSKKMGYVPGVLFTFNLRNLPASRKVLFSYALHGKKGERGILEKSGGKTLGKGVVFVPAGFADSIREFMELWDVDYSAKKVLMHE